MQGVSATLLWYHTPQRVGEPAQETVSGSSILPPPKPLDTAFSIPWYFRTFNLPQIPANHLPREASVAESWCPAREWGPIEESLLRINEILKNLSGDSRL
jgi:hypothetical protein